MEDKDITVLKPSLFKSIALMVVSLLVAKLGFYIIGQGEKWGWWIAGFFGLGAILAFISLLPGSSYLRLTRDGITIRAMYRTCFVPWKEIESFEISYMNKKEIVVYSLTDEARQAKRFGKFGRFLAGNEGSLPDNYSMPADELVAMMNSWLNSSRPLRQ